MIADLDVEALSQKFRAAQPFPHIVIDGFLDAESARAVCDSYPSFEEASQRGRGFETVNEHLKVQVTEYEHFPEATKRLADALAAPEFMKKLEVITGIPNLVWDAEFAGGGMHQTARTGILDVHVDFNLIEDRQLYRRLNLLVYLNPVWEEAWGGALELWDRDVKVLHHRVQPALGRAVLFETSEISFHGVTPVSCPPDVVRKSFAVYYYTKEAPEGYLGKSHSTIFKARPHEYKKRFVTMPLEAAEQRINAEVAKLKGRVKSLLGR